MDRQPLEQRWRGPLIERDPLVQRHDPEPGGVAGLEAVHLDDDQTGLLHPGELRGECRIQTLGHG